GQSVDEAASSNTAADSSIVTTSYQPISGWDSDLTDLSDLSDLEESGAEGSDAESIALFSQQERPSFKIRIPARPSSASSSSSIPQTNGKICTISHCRQPLPVGYRWKCCVQCRLQRRHYQRKRLGILGKDKPPSDEVERDFAVKESPDMTLIAKPLPDYLTPGARLCSIKRCTRIIPAPEEYPYKMCEPCRVRTRNNAKARRMKALGVNTENAGVEGDGGSESDDEPLAAFSTSKRASAGGLRRCKRTDCGLFINPQSNDVLCSQCRARKSRSGLTSTSPLELPKIIKRVPAPSKIIPPYPEYVCWSKLLDVFQTRIVSFLEALRFYERFKKSKTTPAAAQTPQVATFKFEGEYSVVAFDFEVQEKKSEVMRQTMQLKDEIGRVADLAFLPMIHSPPKCVHPSMHQLNSVRGYGTAPNGNNWFRPLGDFYKPGARLTIKNASQQGTFQVQIVKAFLPFTNAVVLLVEPQLSQNLPPRLILKLADRRLWHAWELNFEHTYQLGAQSHFAKHGVVKSSDVKPRLRRRWMIHLQHWETCIKNHHREFEAYQWLTEAQHLGLVPRLFGRTSIEMIDGGGHPSLTRLDGLLIEYVEGRPMSSLHPGKSISIEQAEVVSQHVLELGRRLRRYGVSHNDIHVGNVILRYSDNLPVLIDWGMASCRLADRPLDERWTDFSMVQDYYLDIRRLLRLSADDEGPEKEFGHPEMTVGGVWHRYRTPLSDDEQCRLAREAGEFGWDQINGAIQHLSVDERDKLYDEDTTVDPSQGLRWRVKKGTKTALFDDPVPVQ
ncbi:hypothetical protein H0H93_006712, partial [Arthromyces matolae]